MVSVLAAPPPPPPPPPLLSDPPPHAARVSTATTARPASAGLAKALMSGGPSSLSATICRRPDNGDASGDRTPGAPPGALCPLSTTAPVTPDALISSQRSRCGHLQLTTRPRRRARLPPRCMAASKPLDV